MKGFDDLYELKKKLNEKNKPSIEQLINQAITFHLRGNISEATKYYRFCIDQGVKDHRVFSNYGTILENQGKKQEAENFYRKAIDLNPDFANAYSNLGNVLRDLGKLKEAEISTRKAIDLNPDFANAHSNLGNVLRDLGRLKEAENFYRKAIDLNPKFAVAHSNLGNVLRDLGRIEEAEISYRKVIKLNPNFANAHFNLGSILKDLGRIEEAEISYRKAIKLNPNFAVAHSNLGNIFTDIGRLEEAEISYRKAIKLNPNFAVAHSNLGSILKDLGRIKEAEISTRKAIKLNPNFVNAHFNLGIILKDLGKLRDAFDSYQRVIDINPKFSKIYPTIIEFLKNSDLSQLNKIELKKILTILLEKNDISHKELFKTFKFLYSDGIINNLDPLDPDSLKNEFIFNDKLFINALKKLVFIDPKLEAQLVKIRKKICDLIAKNKYTFTDSVLEFLNALGEQCFLNEYIYSITEEEKKSLDIIFKRCIDGELNEKNISILSCYYPLYRLTDKLPSLKFKTSSKLSFKELIELQIKEPLKEIELSNKIKRLGKIHNAISLKVKSQYEKNPYPRWRYGNYLVNQKLSAVKAVNNQIRPNFISQNLGNKQLKVLIAGCGTGNQILQSQIYKNAQITAIDISLSSLAYAKRKIIEFGIDNVEIIQMDILEVQLLKEQYDIIECAGVLHHMNNPSQGLQALLGILKKTGFLKLGLYSELARQDIVKAKNYIACKQLQPNEVDIRLFRQKVFSGELPDLNFLTKLSDFYSLSEVRDLCFHAQEHRFSINQLKEILQSNELKFLGFLLPQQIKFLYNQYFPKDQKQTNLQNWAKFEEIHPNTFIGMYQFWVSKI